MKTYLLKRLVLIIPTILGISLITFVIIRFAPGDPAAMRIGSSVEGSIGDTQVAAAIIEKTRQQFGLDKPIPVQYWMWLKSIATLDFGRSYKDNRPVMDKIWERLPVTLQLNIIALLLTYVAARRSCRTDEGRSCRTDGTSRDTNSERLPRPVRPPAPFA